MLGIILYDADGSSMLYPFEHLFNDGSTLTTAGMYAPTVYTIYSYIYTSVNTRFLIATFTFDGSTVMMSLKEISKVSRLGNTFTNARFKSASESYFVG